MRQRGQDAAESQRTSKFTLSEAYENTMGALVDGCFSMRICLHGPGGVAAFIYCSTLTPAGPELLAGMMIGDLNDDGFPVSRNAVMAGQR